ncbi:cytochrome P450 71A1-like [Zingiber officinale]|uniref:cytochrome P450 71A1-like n=1 Tax=Zingiber officinale TaxID=94328 RepID=UPI001C4BA825|nr:cytochrome P450 71A1-like [Zingiber officinale]
MAFYSLFFLLPLSSLLLFLLLRSRKQLISGRTNLPPSPPRLPFIGNLHQLGPLLHQSLAALSRLHGPVMLLHLGHVPTLVVSSPDAACDVLRHQDLVCAGRPAITPSKILLDGDIAFAPYGDYWRELRKICSVHLLSSKRVQSYSRAREEEVAAMVVAIATQASTTINLSEIIYSFTNDVICRVVSGKFKIAEGRSRVFAELINENSELLVAVYLGDYFRWLGWVDGLLGYVTRVRKLRKRWEELLDQVIKEHADRASSNINGHDEKEEEKDFVDVLMSLQDKNEFVLDPANLKSLLIDVFGGGTDTSYITLEWAMVELVRNPLVMQKLQEEVRRIANRKRLVKEEDLHPMTYLLAVIKEVLRLHPPVPLILPRETLNDCIIQGYNIPKKTRILVNAWAIGRDPKQWDAPEEFRPERFLDGTVDFNGTDFRYIPFGSGRRVCPGLQFAIVSLELALANLVHQFDWELPDGMEKEEFHTREAPGIAAQREGQLHLVAKPWSDCLEE